MFSKSILNRIKPVGSGNGSSREHADTNDNRILARNWLEKHGSTRKPLEIFMSPDGLLVWFYYSPKNAGNRACPLPLSQDRSSFVCELQRLYEFYQKMASKGK